jgi:hypothetical protein
MKTKDTLYLKSFSKKIKVEPFQEGEVLIAVEFNDKDDILNQIFDSITLQEVLSRFDLEVIEETFSVLKRKQK